MSTPYLKTDPWKIIEEGFDPNHVKSSESIFSLGNGAMGQRANFEEHYSGETFQGSYIGGVYYPDKTRVGWWKNGYPEDFAKVLNAPNWIGIDVHVNGIRLDLNNCLEIQNFRRELDMKNGVYHRSFTVQLEKNCAIEVHSTRFLSMVTGALGVIQYSIKALQDNTTLEFDSYIEGQITNQDSNWNDPFWEHTNQHASAEGLALFSHTLKTHFKICTYAHTEFVDARGAIIAAECTSEEQRLSQKAIVTLQQGEIGTATKFGGYFRCDKSSESTPLSEVKELLAAAQNQGFETVKTAHQEVWSEVWKQSDILIEGDEKAQQAIRFNIFQLNQTYNGKDPKLNIGPKGFTGEKYGGSTYWDTEAYCLPFYMATKGAEVARNLLKYRYDQLDKAIENAERLGFSGGAALYPMVTMNGEECHNEWEITFEEIHRNGAIAYAIYNYERFTGDKTYLPEMGMEVLVGIARFWAQRVNFSEAKGLYVILGVTGPNEYENNVNNNWYTNYIAQWCLLYTTEMWERLQVENQQVFKTLASKLKVRKEEVQSWQSIANQMYFPKHPEKDLFLQNDGFLDKELQTVEQLPVADRPINQHWSWDRILRSPYIKQADVLQGFYFFQEHFTTEALQTHFDYYEPFTVHESSLSPCVHAILAARLEKMEQAYAFYLRTARLDLDDYNKEVDEGLHITSMAGTWMSIVEGFGGMQMKDGALHFNPKLPQQWKAFSFKILYRNAIITVRVDQAGTRIHSSGATTSIFCNGAPITVNSDV